MVNCDTDRRFSGEVGSRMPSPDSVHRNNQGIVLAKIALMRRPLPLKRPEDSMTSYSTVFSYQTLPQVPSGKGQDNDRSAPPPALRLRFWAPVSTDQPLEAEDLEDEETTEVVDLSTLERRPFSPASPEPGDDEDRELTYLLGMDPEDQKEDDTEDDDPELEVPALDEEDDGLESEWLEALESDGTVIARNLPVSDTTILVGQHSPDGYLLGTDLPPMRRSASGLPMEERDGETIFDDEETQDGFGLDFDACAAHSEGSRSQLEMWRPATALEETRLELEEDLTRDLEEVLEPPVREDCTDQDIMLLLNTVDERASAEQELIELIRELDARLAILFPVTPERTVANRWGLARHLFMGLSRWGSGPLRAAVAAL